MEYCLHVIIIVIIYAILALSLNIVAGYCGLLSLFHAGLFGVAAYTTAIMTTSGQFPWVLACLSAVAVCAMMAFVMGLASLRLREDSFAIATFACQIILSDAMQNWRSVTNGPLGIRDIPKPHVFGVFFEDRASFILLATAVGVLVFRGIYRMHCSAFRSVCRGLREDEVLTAANGKSVYHVKITAFVLSACVAGVAGSLYAPYLTYIDPTSFTLTESIFIVTLVILGGAGSLHGPILGALVLVLLPELFRFIDMPATVVGSLRQLLYGLALLACVFWRPQGLIGEYAFGWKLRQK